MKGSKPNEAGFPKVQGTCPACNARSLFLGADGYVTCAILRCPNPCAASEALGIVFPNPVVAATRQEQETER